MSDSSKLTIGLHNILIGPNAGYNFTNESYQFVVSAGGKTIQTEMSHDEYMVVREVVDRAAQNSKESKISTDNKQRVSCSCPVDGSPLTPVFRCELHDLTFYKG